jgi:hypothetical protein
LALPLPAAGNVLTGNVFPSSTIFAQARVVA